MRTTLDMIPRPPFPTTISRATRLRLALSLAVRALPLFALAGVPLVAACGSPDASDASPAAMPEDMPALHHAGLNSTDPDAAIDWYLRLWPAATRSSFAGLSAVASDMYLVFNEVGDAPAGAFDETIGRPTAQSAFWHIGAFANTTDMDRDLAALGMRHLTLYVGPEDEVGVWRSGLAPYSGIVTGDRLADAAPAEPRPGGFSYVRGPDGALFELTGGPNTTASLSHVHFFHEQPQCAANWYVMNLGMTLPPVRNEDGTTSERPLHNPCEAQLGPSGWPSLEKIGTLRQPRGSVVHGNGTMSFYPRQCVSDRCGTAEPLVPSRGQVLDHVGFLVRDASEWHAWLAAQGVTILEGLHDIEEGRAFMIEGPDRLAIELVELGDG